MQNQIRAEYEELTTLAKKLESTEKASDINSVFYRYKALLDTVHGSNEDYKRNTWLYYTELGGIESNIKQATKARSQKARDTAFKSARTGLKADIRDFIGLISSVEKYE